MKILSHNCVTYKTDSLTTILAEIRHPISGVYGNHLDKKESSCPCQKAVGRASLQSVRSDDHDRITILALFFPQNRCSSSEGGTRGKLKNVQLVSCRCRRQLG